MLALRARTAECSFTVMANGTIIDVYKRQEQPLKSIEFNFPIYRDGQEVRRLLWEKGNTGECVVLMSRV